MADHSNSWLQIPGQVIGTGLGAFYGGPIGGMAGGQAGKSLGGFFGDLFGGNTSGMGEDATSVLQQGLQGAQMGLQMGQMGMNPLQGLLGSSAPPATPAPSPTAGLLAQLTQPMPFNKPAGKIGLPDETSFFSGTGYSPLG